MAFVYILASRRHGTLYIGVTNDLHRRLDDHRSGAGSIFSRQYAVYRLVYFEMFERIDEAIPREKQLKNWLRAWKIQLIETVNPDWRELSGDIPY